MIPVINVMGFNIPEAYENSLLELWSEGEPIKTQYDKLDHVGSIDATANITILDPMSEPMIYKMFPGGIGDLREYVMELKGAKDHWVKNIDDPNDNRWEYTYHQRLAKWGTWTGGLVNEPMEMSITGSPINQVQEVIDKLVKQPYTRQAQMITWMPFLDNKVYDPPCLQSIWCRLTPEDYDYCLNVNVRFRSNDAWGAAFMNMFGITMFINDEILKPLEIKLNRKVRFGRMNWQADSYHIYGKDQVDFRDRLLERIKTSDFEDRVWNFSNPDIQEIWNVSEYEVKEKIRKYDKEH